MEDTKAEHNKSKLQQAAVSEHSCLNPGDDVRDEIDATHDKDSSKVKERRKNNEFYADLWNAGGAFFGKEQSDSSHKDDSLDHDKEVSASASVSEDHEASTTINKSSSDDGEGVKQAQGDKKSSGSKAQRGSKNPLTLFRRKKKRSAYKEFEDGLIPSILVQEKTFADDDYSKYADIESLCEYGTTYYVPTPATESEQNVAEERESAERLKSELAKVDSKRPHFLYSISTYGKTASSVDPTLNPSRLVSDTRSLRSTPEKEKEEIKDQLAQIGSTQEELVEDIKASSVTVNEDKGSSDDLSYKRTKAKESEAIHRARAVDETHKMLDMPRRRGKLCLFLGAAPGAGKTFAMLEDALNQVRSGKKVVVAGIGSHSNYETEDLVKCLRQEGAIICNGITLEYGNNLDQGDDESHEETHDKNWPADKWGIDVFGQSKEEHIEADNEQQDESHATKFKEAGNTAFADVFSSYFQSNKKKADKDNTRSIAKLFKGEGSSSKYVKPSSGNLDSQLSRHLESDKSQDDGYDALTVGGIDWADNFVDAVSKVKVEELEEPIKVNVQNESERRSLQVEAIIDAKPDLVVVDNFATTNPLGSPRKYRWQDIEVLLNAGLDVYSALNIQQLDTLNLIVARVTGCKSSSTVPSVIFDAADEVSFVDTSADEILQRIKMGKVSFPAEWAPHLDTYKKKSTLIALRDLTLRQLRLREMAHKRFAYQTIKRENMAISSPSDILLLLNISSTTETVKRCSDIARSRDANWHCVWVGHGRELTNLERKTINELLEMAQSLGASTEVLVGNYYDTIVEYAHSHDIVTIVVSPEHRTPFFRMRYAKLARMLPEANMLFLPCSTKRVGIQKRASLFFDASIKNGNGVLTAFLSTMVLTLIMFPVQATMRQTSILMVFLLMTFMLSLKYNVFTAIASSVFSVASFYVFFRPPVGVLYFDDFQMFMTLIIMSTVGVMTSRLISRNVQITNTAQAKERHTRILYDAARSAAFAVDELRVFNSTAAILQSEFKVDSEFWVCMDKSAKLECVRPRLSNVDPDALQYCLVMKEECGLGRTVFSDSPYLYIPLNVRDGVYGVAVMYPDSMSADSLPEIQRVLSTMVSLVSQTIDRLQSIEEARQTIVTMEATKLRNSLLQSLSHDLRTPLTSLMNNAENMLSKIRHQEYDAAENSATEIIDSAQRMITLMSNLLEMARLQNDAVTLNRTWIPPEELIGMAKAMHKIRLKRYEVKTIIEDDCPMFFGDPVLLERVVANLVDNAAKYCPAGSIIQFHAWGDEEHVSISIEDNGPGLPKDIEGALLFDPFKRGHAESNITGVGLGLAICNTIAKVHDAKLIAGNSSLGGAAFTLVMKAVPMPELEDEEAMMEKIAAMEDIDDELFPVDHELDTTAQDLDAKDQAADLSKAQTPQKV